MRVTFPLILTFSLGEKEQQLDISAFAMIVRADDRLQFARTLGAFLPLPKGEGRGEGKVTSRIRYANKWPQAFLNAASASRRQWFAIIAKCFCSRRRAGFVF
ncbi:MAG TPA: hypothetical protein VK742_01695 [Candidatus Sulfotelmatobacter sp.]|jgi:hypothetical protein|nr:hypothetical protein [Candidatus Sulfotelmatobacter sp.]